MKAGIARHLDRWLRAPLGRSLGHDRAPELPSVALVLSVSVLVPERTSA